MNSQRNGGLRHGHPAQLKCIFYKQKLSRQKSSQIFRVAGGQGARSQRVYSRNTQRTALFCCRMWPRPLWARRDPGLFRAGTHKERRCFAAECSPDPFGHTRALEGPLFDPGSKNRTGVSRAGTQKERKGGDLDMGTRLN